ncbi:MAG: YceI family protein [Candidatus Omnitrophota bacterium]|jgi:polyisoprenoid-binding protein YceI
MRIGEKRRRFFNRRPVISAVVMAAALSFGPAARAQDEYDIDLKLSSIKGSIKYSVVGRYQAEFEKFDGKLFFDPQKHQLTGVDLWIENGSIHSRYESLDKIVLSPRLLYVKKYPQTLFKSKSIVPSAKPNEYQVTGALTLHGITKDITFPFTVEGPLEEGGQKRILAKGEWLIARKDFNMYWHSFLDKGGIVVGNHLTVDWEINAVKK